jgi:hypothetical protein
VDLVGDVPALYLSRSPLNPAALQRKNQKGSSTFGTAAYLAVLEPDLYSKLAVHVPLDTYHKAGPREMRDAAWIAGQTPLKPSEIEIVDGVRDAIQHRPDVARLFTAGQAEVTIQWEMDGVPCRCRPTMLARMASFSI